MVRLALIILILTGFSNLAAALEVNGARCGRIANPMDFYQCSLSKHLGVQVAENTKAAADAALSKAGQFLNPEFDFKNMMGNSGGERTASVEAALNFPLSDYFYIRSTRVASGEADKLLLETESKEIDFNVRRELIKDIFRYRQLLAEYALAEETLTTFERIERQFKSRRARGPEQEITLNLVEMAQGDYQLKKNHLTIERQEIEARFKAIWGFNFTINKNWLPSFKKEWPEVSRQVNVENLFELQKLLAAKNKASAEKTAAIAESWPKLTVGPVYERATAGIGASDSYGIALSLDVPIFSWNSGGRAFAEAQKIRSETQYEYAKRSAALNGDLIYKRYTSAVGALKKSHDSEALAKKHNTIDGLFKQGLAGGSTLIEAHRQIWEFTESQHEHETTAIDAFLLIKQLQGQDVVEVLR